MVFFHGLFQIWLINLSKSNISLSSLLKVTSGATLLSLSVWAFAPSLVSAGIFNFVFAQENSTPRAESLQNLPILESHMSPMLLARADTIEPITDDDSLTASFTVYDLENVYIPERETVSTYVVQSGDTISEIAERFGVTSQTVRWANNMTAKSSLRVGQELVILPISGVRVTVQKGDTLASIAKKYKGDAEEIASYNGIESKTLAAGTMIIIPDGEISIAAPAKSGSSSGSSQYKSALAKISGGSRTEVESGYFIRPVKGVKTQNAHGPYGAIDIGAPVGTPIVAMADGVVMFAKADGWNGAYGGLTIIQHDNGTQTLYAHQSRVNVTAGERVSQGQKIGEVGNTGRSTGPHLHLEVRKGKLPKNFY